MAPHPRQTPITSFFGCSSHGGGAGVGNSASEKKLAPKSANKGLSLKKYSRVKGSNFGQCPLCTRSFLLYKLEEHAANCRGAPPPATAAAGSNNNNPANIVLVPSREPIPGLFLFEDFITEQEEAQILAELDGTTTTTDTSHDTKDIDESNIQNNGEFLPWNASNFNGPHNGKRWGVHCNLRDRKVSAPENPLPRFVRSMLIPRLQKRVRPMTSITPNEANAIDYRRKLGHFLSDHVDDRKLSKEPIANLSLAGDCYMTFRNVAPQRNTAVTQARVWLPRRCLQVLTGRARYDFSHGIQNHDLCSDRRVSVTMRESPLTVNVLQKLQSVSTTRTMPSVPRPVTSYEDSLEPSQQPIPGLFLFEDFISVEEEKLILEELDRPDDPWRLEKHSGVHNEKRWGVEHDLWSRQVRPPKRDLPYFMKAIITPRLRRLAAMQDCQPNEVNAIDYRRKLGHSLRDHADDRQKSKEPIANLSLAGDCYMTYRNEKQKTAIVMRKVLLKRRCLQVMTGTARYDFTHGIENKDLQSDRRVSVTMREIRF